ncbi:hypothetical protein M0812_16135 [Anaeramoeba flamelloides]|uniref:Uncharacterized protein n=1 Tax=Anaeramoeba flamelloides TaxID=1746091 RepID=A0AAV7ZI44_9EUKA|nr:hypothetical protein M0812_16135 [Anaeramoeba flamelloides]
MIVMIMITIKIMIIIIIKNNSERNETIKHTNNFYLNKKINNSVNEKQQSQNEKDNIKTLYQLNISKNHNLQNQKNNTYSQQENFKSSKVTNSIFFQIYSNLVQEEKTELIFSCIDLIKDLVRNLDNHYLEYQVTNSLNDISDLVIKTENYFDKKIKSTHFKDQGLKKKCIENSN